MDLGVPEVENTDRKFEKRSWFVCFFACQPSVSCTYLRTSPGCERCPPPAGTAPRPAWPRSCRWLKNGRKKGKNRAMKESGLGTGSPKAGEDFRTGIKGLSHSGYGIHWERTPCIRFQILSWRNVINKTTKVGFYLPDRPVTPSGGAARSHFAKKTCPQRSPPPQADQFHNYQFLVFHRSNSSTRKHQKWDVITEPSPIPD